MFGFTKIAQSLHSSTKYRADIDGMRAVAVSSVVISHALPSALPGGFIGVDVFFVISGYLISSILIGDLEKNRFSLLRFYDRRVRRIFPALICVLLATLAFGWLILFRPEFKSLGAHVAISALFSENFLLWSESGYFDAESHAKPLLHLWSLAIEEQFYIFWPIIMFLAVRWRANLVALLAVLFAASFALNLYDIGRDPTAAYYSPVGRFWELMIGACLAYLKVHKPVLLSRHGNIQSSLGAMLIVAALALTSPERAFPGFWALLPTIGTFLLLSGGEHSWVNRRILAAPPMVWCGLISYPLYLWHWPLLSYAHIIYGEVTTKRAIVLIAVAVVAAFLTFRFVESPFRIASKGPAKPLLLVAAMLTTPALGGLVYMQAVPPRLSRFDVPTRTAWGFLEGRVSNFDKNGNGIYPLHADRPKLTLFIGDSILAQYAERIERTIAAHPDHQGAVMVLGGSCPPIENVTITGIRSSGCARLRDQAYSMAQEARFGTIVLAASWNLYFTDARASYRTDGKALKLASTAGGEAALDQLGRSITAMVQAGKRVVVVIDNPSSRDFVAPAAATRFGSGAVGFPRNRTIEIEPRQFAVRRLVAEVARRTGAEVIDPADSLCNGTTCRAVSATGMPLHQDASHLNPDWVIGHASYMDATTMPRLAP